jgi:uncharacterized protein YjeT (DUF2065 family)
MNLKYFIGVIGLFLVFEGLPFFAVPHKIKNTLHLILETPDSTLRVMGFIFMILGVLLIGWGQS